MSCGLLKKKYSNETEFLINLINRAGIKCAQLLAELRARSWIPRTNNSLEHFNGHTKYSFTENILLAVKELLGSFIPWETNESRHHASMDVH